MDRDEVYRRALRAAAAVTGRAGRRLAGVSLGLCVAGAGPGCLPSGGGGNEDGTSETMEDQGASVDASARDQGTGGVIALDGAASDDGAVPMRGDLGLMGPRDGAPTPRPDMAVEVLDGSPVPPDASPVRLDAGPEGVDFAVAEEPDAEAPVPDMGPIIEDCLAEGGGVSDWQCCADHNWDQQVAGCSPCNVDFETPPDNWAECVACPPIGRSPRDDEEAETYLMCCEMVGFDFAYGCMAWGPPAPPAFDGLTLAQRLAGIEAHV